MIPPISPPSGDLKTWAHAAHDRLRQLITRVNRPEPQVVMLEHVKPGAKALQDGIMMWDATLKCPVISEGGAWKKVTLT